jgi:hypothetical protein
MTSPFFWLPLGWPRIISLVLLIAITIAFGFGLSRQGRPLKCSAVRNGIGSFELAWKKARAEEILREWKSLVPTALTQLHWDFGFLIVYPLSLSLACAMLAQSQDNTLPELGTFLSWTMLLAGILDACENLALIRILRQQAATEFLVKTASLSASVKFLIVLAGMGYVSLQGIGLAISKRH